jgi:hypothetical protein
MVTNRWRRPPTARGSGMVAHVGQQVWRFGLVELTGIGVGELGERGWDRG